MVGSGDPKGCHRFDKRLYKNKSGRVGERAKREMEMRNPSSGLGPGSSSSSLAAGWRMMMKQRQKGVPTPCCTEVGMKRGPWTPEEDEVLAKFVRKEGEGRWRTLPKRAGLLRCGKSCRLRWITTSAPPSSAAPSPPTRRTSSSASTASSAIGPNYLLTPSLSLPSFLLFLSRSTTMKGDNPAAQDREKLCFFLGGAKNSIASSHHC